ncbi:MAG: hypothetical protein PHC88_05255 [Terrimicrobiaceae bacterium]|nr:hypothetical protein [Terrimicrobiaceae bacterium]
MKVALLVAGACLCALNAWSASDNTLIHSLLKDREALHGVSFAEVLKVATGHRILPVNPREQAGLLSQLGSALDAALAELNDPAHPIHGAGRVNEASRFVEDEIRRQLNALPGWKCSVPLTSGGREQRSGYPDLRVVTDRGVIFYLDPKLYARGGRAGSLRTFYYEPKALTGKIHDDAIHLIAGIEHDGADARSLRLRRWELIDLSRLKVQLKAEFQASNRDLYRDETVVARSAK